MTTPRRDPRRLQEAAWPDMFANLQAAYAELAQAQFELQKRTGEVAEARDLLERVIASMSEALFLMDEVGQVIQVNTAAGALVGRAPADILGQPFMEITGATAVPARPWQLLARAPGGTLLDLDIDMRSASGDVIPVSVSCTLVRDTRGKIVGMLVVARDVTERRRVELERAALLAREQAARQEAQEANRAKDLFLATLSHELRTPLNAMFGWVRMLRTTGLDQATTERALATIERNLRLQAELVEDLLDVSRVVTGKLQLDIGAVDVASVVRSALEIVRPAALAKDIQVDLDLKPLPAPLLADARRLQQVVWNLVSNAIKFTPGGGRVRIAVGPVDGEVEITVTDTGVGIDPEFLPFVFDRFRQADSSTTRAYGGLGLGLAIVRHLVELHGGTVVVESAGSGRGATFRVRLPISEAPGRVAIDVDAGRVPTDRRRPLAGTHVLVVDDGLDDRELVRAVLEDAGASVTAVESAAAARVAFRQQRPDVLISDISMPGEDGYQLIASLRLLDAAAARQVPAIALTAIASERHRPALLRAGFQLHVPKPFVPDVLVQAIADLGAGR